MRQHFTKKKILKTIGFIIGGIILAALGAFIFGFIVMFLWNWLMPVIFGLPAISYIQAWGLVLLSHILFKSPGKGGENPNWKRKFKNGEFDNEMKRRFRNRGCYNMGDESSTETKQNETESKTE